MCLLHTIAQAQDIPGITREAVAIRFVNCGAEGILFLASSSFGDEPWVAFDAVLGVRRAECLAVWVFGLANFAFSIGSQFVARIAI